MKNKNKVSAQKMMKIMVDTNQKVSTLVGLSQGRENNKPYSKAGTATAILLMTVSVVILALMFVPQFAGLIPALAGQWQWVCLGYAATTVIVVSLFNIKMPVRILSAILAIAPIVSNLIVFTL